MDEFKFDFNDMTKMKNEWNKLTKQTLAGADGNKKKSISGQYNPNMNAENAALNRDPIKELRDIAECRYRDNNRVDKVRTGESISKNVFEEKNFDRSVFGASTSQERTDERASSGITYSSKSEANAKTARFRSFLSIFAIIIVLLGYALPVIINNAVITKNVPNSKEDISQQTRHDTSQQTVRDTSAFSQEDEQAFVQILSDCYIFELVAMERGESLDVDEMIAYQLTTEYSETGGYVTAYFENGQVKKMIFLQEVFYDGADIVGSPYEILHNNPKLEVVYENATDDVLSATIVNNGDIPYSVVQVAVEFYKNEEYEHTEFAIANSLLPGERFDFSMDASESDVDQYLIYDIMAY